MTTSYSCHTLRRQNDAYFCNQSNRYNCDKDFVGRHSAHISLSPTLYYTAVKALVTQSHNHPALFKLVLSGSIPTDLDGFLRYLHNVLDGYL